VKINCAECCQFLGEIEKARLRKGISYLCAKCESARRVQRGAGRVNPPPDFMSGLFGSKGRK
jgi:RNase P subunit RPR2